MQGKRRGKRSVQHGAELGNLHLSESEDEEWAPPPVLWAPPGSYNTAVTTAQPPSSEAAGSSGNRDPPQWPSPQWAPQDKPAASGRSREKKKKKMKKKNSLSSVLRTRRPSCGTPCRTQVLSRCSSIVGHRIRHTWTEGGESTPWSATVLDQVAVKPSLYLVKYDGVGCVYGLELHRDGRVRGLEVLPERVAPPGVSEALPPQTLVGKMVEHLFEGEEGSVEAWRGLVVGRAPVMADGFYISYEKDPFLYAYRLLDDYREGDLRILPDSDDPRSPAAEREGEEGERERGREGERERERGREREMVGKPVEVTGEGGVYRTGLVIGRTVPNVYLVMFDGDFHVYVYDISSLF